MLFICYFKKSILNKLKGIAGESKV